jgi:glucose-1-phosphate cytidylyltransferase
LALGYKGNIIRDYFLNYFYYNNDITIQLGNKEEIIVHNHHDEEDWRVTLVDTGADSMTGYRVKLAGKYIEEDRFMLTYGDAVANVNIKDLVEFHIKTDTIGTVTGVYPPSRFGDLKVQENKVIAFKEKAKIISDDRIINGGFFVFKKEFLDYIPDNPAIDLEKQPLEKLTEENQLSVYRHTGFWQCMDTYRDYIYLNNLWEKNPIWKIWNI